MPERGEGYKQDSQNELRLPRLPMPERGEP
jgi:hypothetical protein